MRKILMALAAVVALGLVVAIMAAVVAIISIGLEATDWGKYL